MIHSVEEHPSWSQIDSLLPAMHLAVVHAVVIIVRFGSSLDQNPVLPAVSLELPTPSKCNAWKTRFRQSIFQNFLGEGDRLRSADFNPLLSGKHARASKSISPRTPMLVVWHWNFVGWRLLWTEEPESASPVSQRHWCLLLLSRKRAWGLESLWKCRLQCVKVQVKLTEVWTGQARRERGEQGRPMLASTWTRVLRASPY